MVKNGDKVTTESYPFVTLLARRGNLYLRLGKNNFDLLMVESARFLPMHENISYNVRSLIQYLNHANEAVYMAKTENFPEVLSLISSYAFFYVRLRT